MHAELPEIVDMARHTIGERERDAHARHHESGPVVVVVVYRDGLGAIFESAYLNLTRRLARLGVRSHLVSVSAVGEWIRPRLRRLWAERMDVINHTCPGRFSRLPAPPARWPHAWTESKLLSRWLKKNYGRERVIVHAGGTLAIDMCLKARESLPNLKTVFQCWGPTAAEYLYAHIGNDSSLPPTDVARQAEIYEAQDRNAFAQSDAIVSICEEMTRHLVNEYSVSRDKIVMIPCCVESERFAHAQSLRNRIRQQLGLEDRLITTFVGSLHRWQEPRSVIRAFELIREHQPSAHLLALASNPQQFSMMLSQHGLDNQLFTVLRVPHDEVPGYLNASDIGLLGRGLLQPPSIVNSISSPIKYAEYLASGCPVVLSDGIGDYSELTRCKQLGVVIPHSASDEEMGVHLGRFLSEYMRCADQIRDRCRRVATESLDAATNDQKLLRLYRQLAG